MIELFTVDVVQLELLAVWTAAVPTLDLDMTTCQR